MFFFLIIITVQISLLLQCKFANSTLLSLLRFSYFITPYDAQASSAFSALIKISADTTVILKFIKRHNSVIYIGHIFCISSADALCLY